MSQPPPPPAPAYLYTDNYKLYDYGPTHPLRIQRLPLTHELINRCGLAQPSFPIEEASLEDLAIYHDRRYLEVLQELSLRPKTSSYYAYGLGLGDNPVFPGVFDWSALLTGASLKAMELVVDGGHPVAFNMAGGMHHALAARAAGFCYVNDAVVVMRHLVKRGLRVLYLDVDAHHGDGVQWAFYEDDRVLTLSLHQHPATLFPGTGLVEEMGRGEGLGFSVNVPLWPDTDDDVFIESFDAVVPPLMAAFRPDFVVSQLGVDSFLMDPLANLNLTTRGFLHVLRWLRDNAWGRWIALGGGGYDLANVARAWTLAWAVMQGREDELPEELPSDMCERLRLVPEDRRMLDNEDRLRGRFWARAQRDARETVALIHKMIFPIHQAKPA